MNILVGACGNECENCFHFGSLCDGCFKEMNSSFAVICEAYRCATGRGITQCAECTEFDRCTKVQESKALCPLLIEKFARFELYRADIQDSAH